MTVDDVAKAWAEVKDGRFCVCLEFRRDEAFEQELAECVRSLGEKIPLQQPASTRARKIKVLVTKRGDTANWPLRVIQSGGTGTETLATWVFNGVCQDGDVFHVLVQYEEHPVWEEDVEV